MDAYGLTPVLALISWTFIVWVWLYMTRIPAMTAAKIHPDKARHPGSFEEDLPSSVRAVADNYNHLHEQPTIFYAIMFYAALSSSLTPMVSALAWGYVGARILHSLVQILSPRVIYRFGIFCVGSVILGVIIVTQILAVII